MGESECSVLNMGEEKVLSEEEARARKNLREDKVSNDVSTRGFLESSFSQHCGV